MPGLRLPEGGDMTENIATALRTIGVIFCIVGVLIFLVGVVLNG